MGVYGFWHYFASMDLEDLMMRRVNRGSTLVVDGSNFMYYMMKVAGVFDDQSRLDRRQLGNYRQFREILLREVGALKSLGFKLEFYFDGKMSSFKDINKGTGQPSYKWVKLAKALRYRSKLVEQERFPIGCLTREVMEQVLYRDSDLRIVQCDGEADIDIARRCAELRATNMEAYVYSDDSDFAFTRHNFLIRLGSFTKESMATDFFRVHVWHPERICEVMNIKNQNMLVEFALLLKCDFNQLVKKIDQGNLSCQLPGDGRGVDNFAMLYVYLSSRPAGYQVKPFEDPHGLLTLLLEYSRHFFNLTIDVAVFQQRLDDILRDIRDEELLQLMNDMKIVEENGDSWTDVVVERISDNDSEDEEHSENEDELLALDRMVPRVPADISAALENEWENMTDKPDLIQIGIFVVSFLSNNPEFQRQLEINTFQLRALKQMTTDLVNNKFCEEFRFSLNWEAAKAAERYQRLVRKILSKDIYATAIRQPQSDLVEHLYDGVTYNCLVDSYEKEDIRDTLGDLQENDSSDEEETMSETEQVQTEPILEEVDFAAMPVHELQPLPVDAFAGAIVKTVRNACVSFLKGETGCGKSSRIPLIVAKDCFQRGENCRILICEPKKLAALALYKRVCGELEFAGLNETITIAANLSSTEINGPEVANITYATTNHICKRYLHNISALHRYTHIILDEVHERTLENDLLVMALKTILQEPDDTRDPPRILLLSATMDSLHFSNYFLSNGDLAMGKSFQKSDIAILHVGATRYSYRLHYVYGKTLKPQRIRAAAMDNASTATADAVETDRDAVVVDSLQMLHAQELTDDEEEEEDKHCVVPRKVHAYRKLLDDMFQGWCDAIVRDCDQYGITAIPKASMVKKQMQIAEKLITTCPIGHSVLVFVPGFDEISSMQTKFENDPAYEIKSVFTNMTRVQEEDLLSPVPLQKIRVILATSVAESSVTLPNVHMVIDFGLDEIEEIDVQYHEGGGGGRSIKRYSWISRPSAIQRAGRAGRTSDGLVYRLYAKPLSQAMSPINNCETRNQPLHELVLRLLNAFGGYLGNGQSLTSVFGALIDPPPAITKESTAMKTLFGALKYLHDAFLIDTTDESRCVLTKMGAFVAMLPLSTNLGRFVLYGVELGFAPEAVIIAAALSKRFRPFKATNVSYRAPDDFNYEVRQDFFSSWNLDSDHYSEPIMMASLFLKLKEARFDIKRFRRLCYVFSLQPSRAFAFVDTVMYLKSAVKTALSKEYLMCSDANLIVPSEVQFEQEWQDLRYIDDKSKSDIIPLIQIALLWTSDGNIMRTNATKNRLDCYVAKFDSDQIEGDKLEKELFPAERPGKPKFYKETQIRPTIPAASHKTFSIERSIVFTKIVPPSAPRNKDEPKSRHTSPGMHFSAEDFLLRFCERESMQQMDLFLWEPSTNPGLWDLYAATSRCVNKNGQLLYPLEEFLNNMRATNEDDKTAYDGMLRKNSCDSMNSTRNNYAARVNAAQCRNPLRLFRIQNMLPKYFSSIRAAWQFGYGCIGIRYVEFFRSKNPLTHESLGLTIRTTEFHDNYHTGIDIVDIRRNVLLQPPVRSVASNDTHQFPLPSWHILYFTQPRGNRNCTTNYDAPGDAPLGFRLLNAYTIRRRNHELQVNKRFYEEHRSNSPWHISVEALDTRPLCDRLQGTMAYFAQWEMIDTSHTPKDDKTIEQGNVVVSWSPTKIDSYSYLASSLPYFQRTNNKDPFLYAIANYVVEEDMGDDEKLLSADQVSFLPHPFVWLAVMMTVVSPHWTQYVSNTIDSTNSNLLRRNLANEAYEQCRSTCRNIRSLFVDSASRGIWYHREELSKMVLQLHKDCLKAVNQGRLSSIVDGNGFDVRSTLMCLEDVSWPQVDGTASVPSSREVSHSVM